MKQIKQNELFSRPGRQIGFHILWRGVVVGVVGVVKRINLEEKLRGSLSQKYKDT